MPLSFLQREEVRSNVESILSVQPRIPVHDFETYKGKRNPRTPSADELMGFINVLDGLDVDQKKQILADERLRNKPSAYVAPRLTQASSFGDSG